MREFIWRILHPGTGKATVIATGSAVMLIAALSDWVRLPAFRYASYLLSAYALVIVCIDGARLVKRAYGAADARLEEKLGWWYEPLMNPSARNPWTLVCALLFNLIFALVKLGMGLWYRSAWWLAAGVYYVALAGMRFSLLRSYQEGRRGVGKYAEGWAAYRRTALQLLALTLTMAGVMLEMLASDRQIDYPGVFIYAFALFAFVKWIGAIAAVARGRRVRDRRLAATGCLNLASAMMSVLLLQTALISRFGDGARGFARTMHICAGVGILLIMLAMCVVMLWKSRPLKVNISQR
ncbi:MAG: hypothetical protein IJ074_11485 [Clostridia bacterium]|nr:hypothetical protein [Clostridia bacterium]MBQ8973685.1 hypothetical protein [Clostridia bacterium]